VALAGAIVMLPAVVVAKPLFLVAWAVSLLGGMAGVSQVVRGSGGNRLPMLLAIIAVFMPLLNILVLGAYVKVANGALKGLEDSAMEPEPTPASRPVAREPTRVGTAVAAAQWSQQRLKAGGAKAYVSSAIACIKQAGLRSSQGGGDLEEGSRLHLQFQLPADATQPKSEDAPLMRVAHGNFGVAYLVDLGDHYTWVTAGQLEEAGMTLDELHRVGIANLQRKVGELRIMEGDEAQMLAMGGEFEASLMLVDALWEPKGVLGAYTPNGAIAAIPARDVLAFCDARSKKGLDGVRKVAANPLPEPRHALTTRLFARRNGRWKVLGTG